MKKITIAAFILCLSTPNFAGAAFAQQNQYTGGMKYTTMRPAQDGDTSKKTLYNRKAPSADNASKESAAPKDALPKAEPAAEKPQQETIWDKYKELAQGRKETAKNDSTPQKPEKPQAPAKQAKEDKASNGTGFSSILENYQRSKDKRSQMKSISFKKPEVLKPKVETPSVEAPKPKAQ